MKFDRNSVRSMVSEGQFTSTIYILKTHEPKMNKHSIIMFEIHHAFDARLRNRAILKTDYLELKHRCTCIFLSAYHRPDGYRKVSVVWASVITLKCILEVH